jgi:flagellar motor component MotA
MIDLFHMGGALFMGVLTLLLLIILLIAVVSVLHIINGKPVHAVRIRHQLNYLRSVGLFALVFGILGQMIGLYSAFQHIEAVGNISSSMLAGGLKVSSICTLYGMCIFLISYLIWFGLDVWLTRLETETIT